MKPISLWKSELGTPLLAGWLCAAILTSAFSGLSPAMAQTAKGRTAVRAVKNSPSVSLSELVSGKVISGFRTQALYTDESDKPLGARFVHERTGFTLDVLQIQSVPQGYIYVNSFPTSDKGEPHTQEHLLLGKGSVGRAVSSAETMSLVASNAFTQQLRTSYNFNTGAGAEVFYAHFERQMNALLHPDYTDEEIRREVRNFGITENPGDKTLRLEEKGLVYNEMTSSFARPFSRLFHEAGLLVYGSDNPFSFVSGGSPEALRRLTPEDIRKFHAANYHLGNMGMIGSFSKDMALGEILKRTDAILNRLELKVSQLKFKQVEDLPAPKMAAQGKIEIVEYPDKNEQQPGPLMFVWPATLKVDNQEQALLELFLANVAGDPTTNLYKLLVDTKTRVIDIGARGVFSNVSDTKGNPVYIGALNVTPANMTEEKIAQVRQLVLDEIARVAAFKDGSPELAEFNTRMKNRVADSRRSLSKFVNTPPGFGFRNTGSDWMDQLDRINKSPGFRKSVTLKSDIAFVDRLLAGNTNFWRDYITRWQLTTVKPYALAAKPNSNLLNQDQQERAARAAAEVQRLKAKYNVTDDQEAIRRYKTDYDAASAELDQLVKKDARTRFIDSPPMTLDDQLEFNVKTTPNGVPLVASSFDSMTSAMTGIALRLDGVPDDELFYLSAMPGLLTRVGVIKDGKAISFEEMSELWKKEILSLNSSFSINARTDRDELVVRGSGNDAAEAVRAVEWMKLVLGQPNWRVENLARIRDVVDQTLTGLRNTMQGSEESWVNDPALAYRKQDNPIILTTSSFLTRAHNVHRLRWRLKDAGSYGKEIGDWLEKLGAAGSVARRDEIKALLGAIQKTKGSADNVPESVKSHWDTFGSLPDNAKALAVEAAKDLDQLLNDIPDASLKDDWSYLCKEMKHDLLISPAQALSELDKVRHQLLTTGGARLFVIGSHETQQRLDAPINALLGELSPATFSTANRSKERLIDQRLAQRLPEARGPVFVGLLNPNAQGGVIMNSAPLLTYQDTDREALLQYLASKLYGGGGAHSIFTKTIGAGLAYSNGLGGSPTGGRQQYYAERTPEMPQTLRFVIDELRKAPRDSDLTEYAIAQAFQESRAASTYEARGEAMAADVADGLKPEQVKQFRKAVLELRKTPKLSDELFDRMATVYARVLPGYDPQLKAVPGAIYFVIGPEKQFAVYDAYLKSALGQDTRLYRLYPRDFWMTMKD
jgi:Zn-dependent M16 (insulinase) family peptidase